MISVRDDCHRNSDSSQAAERITARNGWNRISDYSYSSIDFFQILQTKLPHGGIILESHYWILCIFRIFFLVPNQQRSIWFSCFQGFEFWKCVKDYVIQNFRIHSQDLKNRGEVMRSRLSIFILLLQPIALDSFDCRPEAKHILKSREFLLDQKFLLVLQEWVWKRQERITERSKTIGSIGGMKFDPIGVKIIKYSNMSCIGFSTRWLEWELKYLETANNV
jgi:hypothetical protein